MPRELFLIWSRRHKQWWGPDHCGYTLNKELAGLYSSREAADIILGSLPGQNIAFPESLAELLTGTRTDPVEVADKLKTFENL